MIIAITGITGHIGNTIARELIKDGHSLNALIRSENSPALKNIEANYIIGDLFNTSALDQLCQDAELLIHLAGKISIYPSQKKEIYKTNIDGVKNVIDACKRNGIKKIIHFSSIHAHVGLGPKVNINEATPYVTSENSPYDYSKATGEQLMIQARKEGLDVSILNPTGVLGPDDYQKSLSGKMLLDIYHGNLPMIVKGGFDWVDTRDIAYVVKTIITKNICNEKFLLSGNWAEITYLANRVSHERGKKYRGISFPLYLAKLGLPFVSIISKITGKPALYTSKSLNSIEEGSHNVEHLHATQVLDYNPRPIDDTISDSVQWLTNYYTD